MKHLLLAMAMIVCGAAFGQDAMTHYFPAGKANAEVLVKGYVTPMAEDLGTLANGGWYNTGATHKKFGFDLSITMNTVFFGSDRKSFSPPSLSGTSFNGTFVPAAPTTFSDRIPTIYGNEKEYPSFTNTGATNPGVFVGPDGIDPKQTYGVSAMVLPTIQAGIGLFKNTDLRLRFTPQQTINGITTGTMGGAIMHDIKQHIPGLKLVPFSLSVLVGYTQLDGKIDLTGTYDGAGQEGKIKSSSTVAQILISKSLAIITFYGGLGYSSSTTKFNVNGHYDVDHFEVVGGTVAMSQPFPLDNPYKYSFKTSGFKATIGTRLKLGPLFFNGDYSFVGSQKLLTVGAGFTFH